MNSIKKHITIFRGCLNSMSCMKHFCRYIGSTESISMIGAGLAQYMVRLQTVSGAVDE